MSQITSAKFVKSSVHLDEFPDLKLPEFAFIGRSNVGKSSLINFLCNNRNLAKTSSKPGRTRLINHFLINNSFYFVDLPGYGFAKSSKTDRQRWGHSTEDFLLKSKYLEYLFVLIDINIPPQQMDLEFLSWLKLKQIPFGVVLTKIDKLNQAMLHKQTRLFDGTLSQILEIGDKLFRVSTVKKKGKEEILEFVFSKLESNS